MNHIDRFLRVVESSLPLGTEVKPDGTRLIGRVPHVAPEAWLHALFGPLSPDEVVGIGRAIDAPIPAQLARFYSQFNGISIFSDALSIYGLRRDRGRTAAAAWQPYDIITPNTLERPADTPQQAVIIGGYNYDGSLVYINSADDSVHRCSRESARPLNTWANLAEMLGAEAERIARLFDAQGQELDESVSTAPDPHAS